MMCVELKLSLHQTSQLFFNSPYTQLRYDHCHFVFATYTCDPVTAGCHITMAGRTSRASAIAAHPEQCTDNDNTAAVRCCDDSGGGFSPGCQTLDYEGAAAHCASTQGHRLCTKGELDQTKGSGCGFDNVRAWTSSTQEGSTSRFL